MKSINEPKSWKYRCLSNTINQFSAFSAISSLTILASSLPVKAVVESNDNINNKLGKPFPLNSNYFPPTSLSKRCYDVTESGAEELKIGIQSSDILYPSYFEGTWDSSSQLVQVYAPLGDEIFGKAAKIAAEKEKDMNTILNYKSKFKSIPSSIKENSNNNGNVIADRLYNVESIAIASMGGEKSIIDDKQIDNNLANRVSLKVSPEQSKGQIFDIIITNTDRQFGIPANGYFECLERCYQEVAPVVSREIELTQGKPPSLIKQIETITLYHKIKSNDDGGKNNDNNYDSSEIGDIIVARQRTATYLSPYDARYKLSFARDKRVESVAVDVRFYDVMYKRIR